jgi:hypothetical protein
MKAWTNGSVYNDTFISDAVPKSILRPKFGENNALVTYRY